MRAMASTPSLPSLLILLLATFTITTCHPLPTIMPSAVQQSLIHRSHLATKDPNLPYSKHFFPQILDHFNFLPSSYKIFYQKYLVNSTYWGGAAKASPIFVYTGNEGKIDWFAENTGFLMDIAPKFKALIVFIEHRFYGESLPFGKDYPKRAEKLGYLSSEQALADYAALITSLKHNLSAEASPVVVFGGSYAGMLAAWFRLKYPHVAMAALASSAPILQFDNITPWSSFCDTVSKDFKDESVTCFEVIKGSWDELVTIAGEKDGLKRLSKTFRTCKTLTSVRRIINWLGSAYTYTAMTDYPIKANFMMPLPPYPVKEMCRKIDESVHGVDKVTRVFSAASVYHNYSGSESCFDVENSEDPHGLGLWGWQACTEMVMPMTCSNEGMFPASTYDFKEFSDYCMGNYGVAPRPHSITTEYGGNRIELVLKRFGSNIIFSNGMRDPWSRGGVLKNISSSIVALVLENGAHHLDFRFATKEDPKWLREHRNQEVEILERWIQQYYTDSRNHKRKKTSGEGLH